MLDQEQFDSNKKTNYIECYKVNILSQQALKEEKHK